MFLDLYISFGDSSLNLLVKMYIDFLYSELEPDVVEEIMNIPPGLKILRNNTKSNLFDHPHIVLWHKFLLRYFNPEYSSKPYAILMPCTPIKPYRLSATHRIVDSTLYRLRLDHYTQIYVLSEPMVIVPRELDIYYPFANYEYPIYELSEEYRERFVSLLSIILPKLEYHKKIIAVLPKHHKAILLESFKKSKMNTNIEILDYGKKSFSSVRKAVDIVTKYIKEYSYR